MPENVEQEGSRHGIQRSSEGYTVVEVMRELNLYRRVLLNTVDEVITQDVPPDGVIHARRLMLELVDRSFNASVEQYTAQSEKERAVAKEEAQDLHEQRDRFLMTQSHELRNQISPILLNVQLLKDLRPT